VPTNVLVPFEEEPSKDSPSQDVLSEEVHSEDVPSEEVGLDDPNAPDAACLVSEEVPSHEALSQA
jgi:hypothetical protein